MDPICCLLGVCCPPEERIERVIVWIMSWGIERQPATICATNLAAAIDGSFLGRFLREVVAHAKHV